MSSTFNDEECARRELACFYENRCSPPATGAFPRPRAPPPGTNLSADERASAWLANSLWSASDMMDRLLRPNARLAAYLERFLPSASQRPCLAVHLRYGDSCGYDAARTARRCDNVSEYVDAVRRMHHRYGYRSLVLSSDSANAMREFRRELWGSPHASLELKLLPVLSHEGAVLIGDYLRQIDAKFERFDSRRRRASEWDMWLAFIIDLHRLAACDGLVGKFTSNVPRIVLALMARAARGVVGPAAPFGARRAAVHLDRRQPVVLARHGPLQVWLL